MPVPPRYLERPMKTPTRSTLDRVFAYSFASIHALYVQKVEKKGRTQGELDQVLCWLTGYTPRALASQIKKKADLRAFFHDAPSLNPNAAKITGVICGVRVEDIEDPLMRKIRYMDKLVDELAKGRPMEKILRA
jgi:hypothetical protein